MSYLKTKILIYPVWETQIALILVEKDTVPAEYLEYANIFSEKSVVKLPERTDINKYLIKLKPDKQLPYKPIYSLELYNVKVKEFIYFVSQV